MNWQTFMWEKWEDRAGMFNQRKCNRRGMNIRCIRKEDNRIKEGIRKWGFQQRKLYVQWCGDKLAHFRWCKRLRGLEPLQVRTLS